ncbi:MAG: hypothetical protein ACLVB5_16255 [Christensenellales bacterium]
MSCRASHYDAIALAYTPGSHQRLCSSFCAYGGQANVCVVDRRRDARSMPRIDVWNHGWTCFLRYAEAGESVRLQADMRREEQAGCSDARNDRGSRVYLAYRPIEDTPVHGRVRGGLRAGAERAGGITAALIARIAAAARAMLAAGGRAARRRAYPQMVGRESQGTMTRGKASWRRKRRTASWQDVNAALRESVCGARKTLQRTGARASREKKPPDIDSVSRRHSHAAQRGGRAWPTLLDTWTEDSEDDEAVYARTDARRRFRTGDGGAGGQPGGAQTCGFGRLCQRAAGGRRRGRLDGSCRVLLAEDSEN